MTPLPLEILIDTSSNGNSGHIFVLKARNRAWPHFYSSIQILGASPFGPPPFLAVPLAMVCMYYLYQAPNRKGRVGVWNAVDGYGRAGIISKLMFIALRNKGTKLLSVRYSGL